MNFLKNKKEFIMGWDFEIFEEEREKFGSKSTFYLLGEKRIDDILNENRYRSSNSYLHKWCNAPGEQRGPYNIIIINNRRQLTLDVKTACLEDANLEWAMRNFKLLIKARQIEKQIENIRLIENKEIKKDR